MSASLTRKIGDDAGQHPEMGKESDAALFSLLSGGDLSALGILYDRYHRRVLAFVRRATGSRSAAEDITQETFLTLARLADRYDGRGCARPFIMGIASKHALEHRRTLARCGQVMCAFAEALREITAPSPERLASAAEELRRFDRALLRLSAPKRVVILLVDVEGLSGEEVARTLDIPLGTVWTRLHYGRAELRAALEGTASGATRASE
jgi:RNA polymerase sigma-70 factor (ECF subfamily)